MSKEQSSVKLVANLMLEWIEHTSNKSHEEQILLIEDKLTTPFLTLCNECKTLKELESQLDVIVNSLSFQVNLSTFDQKRFRAFVKSCTLKLGNNQNPESEIDTESLLLALPALLTTTLSKRKDELEERQENFVESFVTWAYDQKNVNKAEAVKTTLENMRLGSDMITDEPGEAIKLLQFVFKPTMDAVISQLDQSPIVTDALIVALEKVGEDWQNVMQNELDDGKRKQLDFHTRPYACFLGMLQHNLPLQSNIIPLFNDIKNELQKFKEVKTEYLSKKPINTLIIDELNKLIQTLYSIHDFILFRHNTHPDYMNEAINKKERISSLFKSNTHLLVTESEEDKNIHQAFLSAPQSAMVILDTFISAMKHINFLRSESAKEITNAEKKLNKHDKNIFEDFFSSLKNTANTINDITDINQLLLVVSLKISELKTPSPPLPKSNGRLPSRLFSHDGSSSPDHNTHVRNSLLNLLQALTNIVNNDNKKNVVLPVHFNPSEQNSPLSVADHELSDKELDQLTYRTTDAYRPTDEEEEQNEGLRSPHSVDHTQYPTESARELFHQQVISKLLKVDEPDSPSSYPSQHS